MPLSKQDLEAGLKHTEHGISYDPLLALRICERISQGETLLAVCASHGMPTRQTFYKWVVNQPDLARAYSAAKVLSADSLEEEALEAGRSIRGNPETSQKVRAYEVDMNQLRWSAAKRNPRVYSDRGSIVLTVPIQINTPLNLGQEGAPLEIANEKSVYQIEATVELPPEPAAEPELDRDRMARGGAPVWGVGSRRVNPLKKALPPPTVPYVSAHVKELRARKAQRKIAP